MWPENDWLSCGSHYGTEDLKRTMQSDLYWMHSPADRIARPGTGSCVEWGPMQIDANDLRLDFNQIDGQGTTQALVQCQAWVRIMSGRYGRINWIHGGVWRGHQMHFLLCIPCHDASQSNHPLTGFQMTRLVWGSVPKWSSVSFWDWRVM